MSVISFPSVSVVGARDRDIEGYLAAAGIRVTSHPAAELTVLAHPTARAPQVLLLDLRDTSSLPTAVAVLRKHHPETSVVLAVSSLDPALMLEAMRAGVTEIVPEPLSAAALKAALTRVWQPAEPEADGQVIAVIGAKGGIGATTIAVNLSTVLAKEAPGDTLLMDFHVAQGDAALLLGATPRFSVVDALENTHRLDDAFFRSLVVQVPKGPHLLASSERHVVGAPGADRVRAVIDFAARTYRYIILDLPRNDLTILDGLDSVHRIAVVVNQELSGIRNATRLLDTLGQRYGKDKLLLVLSRFDKGAEIERLDIEKVVGIPISYVVPNDYRAAVRAANQGSPLAFERDHKVAVALKDMARSVANLPQEPSTSTASGGGLLGRLAFRKT